MSDTTSNFNSHFVGRDGFYWWLGQVAPEETWRENKPNKPVDTTSDIKGFGERYRVRIMGYHSCVKDIPDDALPWAYVMYPVTAGGGGRNSSQSSNITQGDFVYGFFLDGENAQTPVIMGIIGNNEYNKVLKGLPQDECYVPFSGYSEDDDTVSSTGVKDQPGESEVIEQVNSKGQSNNAQVNESATGDTSIKPVADTEAAKSGQKKEPILKPSECEKNPLGAIQTELSNAMQEIQKIKSAQFDSRLSLVLGTAGDIASQIDDVCQSAAEYIAGILKTLLINFLKELINKTGEQTKEASDQLHPNERPTLRRAVEEILEQIVCLIRKLIDQLLDLAKDFVCQAADKAVTTPPCLVENFVGNVLGEVGGIDGTINDLLSQLTSLIGGLGGSIGGGISVGGGLGILDEIMSFLQCDEGIECSPITEWSILSGASASASFSFNSLSNVAGSYSSGSSGNPDLNNVNVSDSFRNTCDSGPILCGPPTPVFIGGGSGAKGNFIISSNGEIIGIDMVNGGSGYNSSTFAVVNDPCGNGGGAIISPIIDDDDGSIIDIIVLDPGFGYLPEPDGSKGGDGNKWSDPDDTIIIRDDVYDPPTPPGNVVEVNPGDTVELPPGTEVECIGSDCVQTFTGGKAEVVTCPCKFTTPVFNQTKFRGNYPNVATGTYPAILYLCGIRVLETGINYASIDEVVIEPDFGAKATLEVGDQGIVRSVKVIQSGEGITEMPRVYIKTNTGFNAVLIPKLCIDRVGEDVVKEPDLQDKIVSVVDCVGKFDVK